MAQGVGLGVLKLEAGLTGLLPALEHVSPPSHPLPPPLPQVLFVRVSVCGTPMPSTLEVGCAFSQSSAAHVTLAAMSCCVALMSMHIAVSVPCYLHCTCLQQINAIASGLIAMAGHVNGTYTATQTLLIEKAALSAPHTVQAGDQSHGLWLSRLPSAWQH